jgi:L-lactate dehydrogenase (cytochrome)
LHSIACRARYVPRPKNSFIKKKFVREIEYHDQGGIGHRHAGFVRRPQLEVGALFKIMRDVTYSELAEHGPGSSQQWTAINGVVYDVSNFAHPGGDALVQKLMGKDGTSQYSKAHPKDLVDRVLGTRIVGKLTGEKPKEEMVVPSQVQRSTEKPELSTMINTFDFEAIASQLLPDEAWQYYSSGADDEICLRENRAVFSRVRLKPRILVNVRNIDMTTTICGIPSSLPLYFTATALGKLAHDDGEVAITRAAHEAGLIYMLPTLSSCTLDEMLQARAPAQPVFSQLYVNPDRSKTRDYVKKLKAQGVRALFVTVDAPQLGRREKDMRNKFVKSTSNVQKGDNVKRDEGVTRAISSFIDPGLNWDDIPWLMEIAGGMPVFLKGVQCAEDAVMAHQKGLSGLVLSNHGGRQIDSARSGLEILAEVMPALRSLPGYNSEKFQVYIDGGIRRGADIFKALALGARAVGVGRPVLYALASFGQEGIGRMVHIFRDELEMTMRLMGTPKVSDINSKFILPQSLADVSGAAVRDFLQESTYEPLQTQAEKVGYLRGRM